MNEPRKLKRVVIKEELVELTGNFVTAILLQQMLYWSERVQDFKKFAQEEQERVKKWCPEKKGLIEGMAFGWMYKTAEELSSETMLGLAANSIRRHIRDLIEQGYLLERRNPSYKWDKTLQYRIDLVKVQSELLKLGYSLEGYSVELPPVTSMDVRTSKTEVRTSKTEVRNHENGGAIPKTTTETTTETFPPYPPRQLSRPVKTEDKEEALLRRTKTQTEDTVPYNEIVEAYHLQCPSLPRVIKVTDARKKQIAARWKENSNINIFTELFQHIERSDFLTNRGNINKNGWSCTFDWALNDQNMTKILEGRYNNKTIAPTQPQKEPQYSGWGHNVPDYVRQIAEMSAQRGNQ